MWDDSARRALALGGDNVPGADLVVGMVLMEQGMLSKAEESFQRELQRAGISVRDRLETTLNLGRLFVLSHEYMESAGGQVSTHLLHKHKTPPTWCHPPPLLRCRMPQYCIFHSWWVGCAVGCVGGSAVSSADCQDAVRPTAGSHGPSGLLARDRGGAEGAQHAVRTGCFQSPSVHAVVPSHNHSAMNSYRSQSVHALITLH